MRVGGPGLVAKAKALLPPLLLRKFLKIASLVFPWFCYLPNKYVHSHCAGGSQESTGCTGLVLGSCRELVGLRAARALLLGLLVGGSEGNTCDEAEVPGGPAMHKTALTLSTVTDLACIISHGH